MTPEKFKARLAKNPWFIWILIILGLNPWGMSVNAVDHSVTTLKSVASAVYYY